MTKPNLITRLGDSFRNLVSGVATSKDKAANWSYSFTSITQQELDVWYAENFLARKCVDIIPFDMTRQWRVWQAKQAELIYEVETDLAIKSRLRVGLQYARLYGGAAILIGDGTSAPELPLDTSKISKGGVKYLHVFSRWSLVGIDVITDINNPDFGKPEFYRVTTRTGLNSGLKIHRTRFVFLKGPMIPESLVTDDGEWGMSILQHLRQNISQAMASATNTATMTEEAKIDVITVPDLGAALSTPEGTKLLIDRFLLANQMKSSVNTLLLGADEIFNRHSISFAGLPEVIMALMQIVSAAADIPMTRLMSQSPAGMNATGESDLQNYYDRVKAEQSDLKDALRPLDDALIRHAIGDHPADVEYEWSPLWQMSDKDRATIDYQKSQTINQYVTSGLFAQEELRPSVAEMLVEDGFLPTLDQHLLSDDEWMSRMAPEPDPNAEGGEGGTGSGSDNGPNAGQNPGQTPPKPGKPALRVVGDMEPRTLYVRRDVLNASEIRAWARSQGLKKALPADDMHVTVCFSKSPLDWFKVEPDWSSNEKLVVPPGGARVIEQFKGGAVVLRFQSRELTWRNEQFREAGASSDFPDYKPHITITYDPGDVDPEAIEAYTGRIVLGPEIFEEVNDDWKAGIVEDREWDEEDHPRDEQGRFSESGGGGGGSIKTAARDVLARNIAAEEKRSLDDMIADLPQATQDRMAKAEQDMAQMVPNHIALKDANGFYVPERAALHARILAKMFTPERIQEAIPEPGQKPVLTMTGGRTGAGKSTSLEGRDVKGFLINSDEIQEHLPGYNGAYAGIYSGEAQDIASQAESIARAARLNIIYDATMKTTGSAKERMEQYQKDGYDVDIFFTHTTPQTSVKRAAERFMRTGRYVPLAIPYNSLTNEQTFDALKDGARKWALYDNNGAQAKLIAEKKGHG